MKVLLITSQYVEKTTDGCFCDSALISTLENIRELGDIYAVVGNPNDKIGAMPRVCKVGFIKQENVEYLRPINKSITGYLRNIRYNSQLLESLIPQMNLVVGYIPNGNAYGAYKIARRYKIPFLSFVVACTWDALHNHQRFYARVMAPFQYLITRYIIRNSDYVHYVTKEFLQRRYPTKGKSLGCSDINLRRLDIDVLYDRLARLKNTHDDVIKLVTTAHVDVRYKGQKYVIRAIAKLKARGENRYRYFLIGGGNGDYLRNLAKKLNVENDIIFLGRKKWEDVMQILSESDIYIQPSLQEGLPRSVIEAMSTGLPCVGFNTGGIPELIESKYIVKRKSVNGIIACLMQLQNKSIYAETAQRNFHIAENYNHDKLVAIIKDFFKDIRCEIEHKNI